MSCIILFGPMLSLHSCVTSLATHDEAEFNLQQKRPQTPLVGD